MEHGSQSGIVKRNIFLATILMCAVIFSIILKQSTITYPHKAGLPLLPDGMIRKEKNSEKGKTADFAFCLDNVTIKTNKRFYISRFRSWPSCEDAKEKRDRQVQYFLIGNGVWRISYAWIIFMRPLFTWVSNKIV